MNSEPVVIKSSSVYVNLRRVKIWWLYSVERVPYAVRDAYDWVKEMPWIRVRVRHEM